LEAALSYWCFTYPTAKGYILLEDSNFHLHFLTLCAVALNLNFTEQYSAHFYTVVSFCKTSKGHGHDV